MSRARFHASVLVLECPSFPPEPQQLLPALNMSSQQLYIEYLDFKHNYYIALRGLYTGDLSRRHSGIQIRLNMKLASM